MSCLVEGCDRESTGLRGYCGMHYQRLNRAGAFKVTSQMHHQRNALIVCKAVGCDLTIEKGDHGYCSKHAQRMRKRGTLALQRIPPEEDLREQIIENYKAGESTYYIGKLYDLTPGKVQYWLTKWGINKRLPGFLKGQPSPLKKGRKTDGYGYILISNPDHPNASKGYVREHRLLMEQKLGRFLTKDEVVHHVNNNPSDNRIENLEVISRSNHSRDHRIALGRLKSDAGRFSVLTITCDCCGANFKRRVVKLCRPCRAPSVS